MTGVRYLNLLKNNLLQSFLELKGGIYNREGYIFQNDNAGAHRVPLVQRWKENHAIRTIAWLTLVLWRINGAMQRINSIRFVELYEAQMKSGKPRRIWYAVLLEMIKQLYHSLPRRMILVIRRRGEKINY